ncbi:cell division protein DivIVA [Streptomyces sp. NPDC057644]|uniref:cell division protein DivIVA n=1 Tax=Streptomyces sp. NPDC057644 TaxID=3346191 RepID=UPI0036C6E78B
MARSEPDEVSAPGEMRVFWFLLLTMVVVVTVVTLAVVGGGGSAVLQDVPAERFTDPLPATRPVGRADVEALRLPMALRGYRMVDVDEALSRLGAELAERDARIAELESSLAGAQAAAVTTGTDLFKQPGDRPASEQFKQSGDRPAPEPADRADGPARTEEDGR